MIVLVGSLTLCVYACMRDVVAVDVWVIHSSSRRLARTPAHREPRCCR